MHQVDEPFDANAGSADPKVTLSLIETWLRSEITTLDAVVKKLDQAAKCDNAMSAPMVLVTESSANICNAYPEITDRLKFIAATIDAPPDA